VSSIRGRTIRLFLVDGSASGLLAAEVMNWSGKVLAAPRTQLGEILARPEAARTGVYLLVGNDPVDPSRERVYIGEADVLSKRIASHDKDEDKDFFTRIVLIASADANVTKAHARYLETRLIETVKGSNRAILDNGTGGSPVSLPESDRADMESFLEQVQLILPVIGVNLTQPRPNAERAIQSSPLFVFSAAGAAGKARQIDDAFVLLRGSTCRKEGVPSWTSFKVLRDRLVAEKRLASHPSQADNYMAVEDIEFSSPSAAGAVVAGRNTNGRQSWKVEGSEQTYEAWASARQNLGAV
jgi:Domain of unknown function (DUF4357)